MNIFEIFVDKLTNPVLIDNLTKVSFAFFLALGISFVLAPFSGKLAFLTGALDLPPHMRRGSDKTASRRIHDYIVTKLGGVGILISIIVSLLVTSNIDVLPKGVMLGLAIIFLFGLMDDIYDMNAKTMLFGQFLVAFILVFSGYSITKVDLSFVSLDLNWFSDLIFSIGPYTYNFIFPADIITMIWIVGLMNVVNWTDGLDLIHGTITSLALLTMLLLVLLTDPPNILIASAIAIHLGSVMGLLPYNYNPAKIYYASTGAYINGYLLAVFSIFSGTRWAITITVLGIFIIDAIFVMVVRLMNHPEARLNPLKLLSISDKNHLHHRLLAAGHSKKMVALIEFAMTLALCTLAFAFSGVEKEYMALIIGGTILVVSFTIIFFLKKRNEKTDKLRLLTRTPNQSGEDKKEVVIKVLLNEEKNGEEEDYEKFIY